MVVLGLFVILRRGLWPNTLIRFFYPHNSPSKLQSFSSLRKIGFQFYVTISPTLMAPFLCVSVFSPAMSTLLTLRHLRRFSNYFTRCPVPHVLRCDENITMEVFHRDSSGNFPAHPLILYKTLKESRSPIFWIFNS